MPRRSNAKTEVADGAETKATRVSLADAYKRAKPKVDPVLMKEGRSFGAHNITFKPLYEPEGFQMAWVDVPSGDPSRDERFYRLLNEEGYVLMRPEHVADTLEEAREDGLFYFRVKLDVVSVNGTDAVGFSGRGIVAVWRPKEVSERMYRRRLELFQSMLTAEGKDSRKLSVSVTGGRSTLGDIVASKPQD